MNIASSHKNLICQKHPSRFLSLIYVNKEEEAKQHIFYCDLCILQDLKFKSPDFVDIQQILESSNNSHIFNWPPLEDQLLKDQILKILNQNKQHNKLEFQINQYFDNLKAEILSKIDSCQKIMINKALANPLYQDQILKKLQEISMTDQFKNILLNSNNEIKDKEEQCREFIHNIHQQKSSYTSQLKQIFDKLTKNEQQIDFKTPDILKESILELIQDINFFIQDSHQNNDKVDINLLSKHNNQTNQKVEKLIDLISVKPNFLSNNFIDSIKKVFNQISPLINQVKFDEIHSNNINPIDFSKLCERQMKTIRDLVDYFTKQQTNQNPSEQIRQSTQFKQISLILNNKANYLQRGFIDEFEKYIIETYPLLKQIDFNNCMKDHHQLQTYIDIEDVDLQNICELIQKKKVLEQNYNSQSFEVNQQVSPLLEYLKKQNDLLKPIENIDLLPNFQLIQSNFESNNLKNIKMKKIKNNSIQITSQNGDYGSYYSNLRLDRNKKYMFRFQFKRDKKNEAFAIGLIRDEIKDNLIFQ